MVALREFHCFNSLPSHIQDNIWTFATLPRGPISLHSSVTHHYSFTSSSPELHLRDFLERTSPTRMRAYILVDKKQHRATARARRDLMSTSRGSRKMVIGVWVVIVRELLKDAGPEADRDLPTLLSGLVFKAPDPAEERRTFHRFPELPTELQVQIWKMVSLPGGMIGLREEILLPNMSQWGYPDPDPGWSPPRLCCSERLVRLMLRTKKRKIYEWLCDGTYRAGYGAAEARNNLVRTCRMSREVAVESWKRIVEAIPETVECKFDRQNIIRQLDNLLANSKPAMTKIDASPTFPRFSALPIKVRTMIWKYASLPEGDFTLSPDLFRYIDTVRDISNRRYIRFLEQTSPLKIPKWVEAEESHLYNWKAVEGRKATLASKARNAMMGTNRAARKVALDVWSSILHHSRPARPVEWRDVEGLPRPHPYWGWKFTDNGVLTVMRKGFIRRLRPRA